jgi:hypothetical protein
MWPNYLFSSIMVSLIDIRHERITKGRFRIQDYLSWFFLVNSSHGPLLEQWDTGKVPQFIGEVLLVPGSVKLYCGVVYMSNEEESQTQSKNLGDKVKKVEMKPTIFSLQQSHKAKKADKTKSCQKKINQNCPQNPNEY